jgi:hypothetical protein
MRDIYNSFIPLMFAPKGTKKWAITFGQTTFYSVCECKVDAAWRAHENTHKKQYRMYGFFTFMYLYVKEYLHYRRHGYTKEVAYRFNRYECEAVRAENAVRKL